MKQLLTLLSIVILSILFCGCASFPWSSSTAESADTVGDPPSHFLRSTGHSTGVDPIARDIEKNLGYK